MPKMSKDLIGLENVESYWPRRLLCVKDWTSYERRDDQGRIMYGQVTKPIYNIVSYTWGRFRAYRDEEGSAIQIRGINWQIPRIKPHAQHGFSSNDFRTLLENAASESGWVWVDVACIPQAPTDPEQADILLKEIGHQAGIFARAEHAFIWLHGLSTKALDDGTSDLKRMHPMGAKTLLTDMWFTSLWTLQEAFLRKDAFLLSATAEKARYRTTLRDLIGMVDQMLHDSGRTTFFENFRYSGLETLQARNPLPLLGVVPHRQVSSEKDNVCGIMQVFGLQLDANRELDQLQYDLCCGINRKSPVIGQAFVHLIPYSERREHPSWQFQVGTFNKGRAYRPKAGVVSPYDQTKIVPRDFYDVYEVPSDSRASVSFERSGLIFHGQAVTELGSLVKVLEQSVRYAPEPARPASVAGNLSDAELDEEERSVRKHQLCSVYCDAGPWNGVNPFVPKARDPLNQPNADAVNEMRRLSAYARDKHMRIGVLAMGRFRAAASEGDDDYGVDQGNEGNGSEGSYSDARSDDEDQYYGDDRVNGDSDSGRSYSDESSDDEDEDAYYFEDVDEHRSNERSVRRSRSQPAGPSPRRQTHRSEQNGRDGILGVIVHFLDGPRNDRQSRCRRLGFCTWAADADDATSWEEYQCVIV